MATFYLDPVNGNDANDGTTFANRWLTLTSGATAARIAPGDTIRIIGSPDPTSLGNATWTNESSTVTLAGALTADITQATTAWTASTNVTTTTSTNRKLGATSSSIAIQAAFTTGKAAYLNLGTTLNLSSYQQVSFWIQMTAGSMTADGDITLRLCSDTTGDVTVNTISVPKIRGTGGWCPITVDTGGALGSSIQSIALYVAVDRSAQTFLINNVLACKASSSADSLSLTSMISKNTGDEPWLGIQSINGTTVTLEVSPNYSLAAAATTLGYAGTTATVTTYKRDILQLNSAVTNWGTIQDSGTGTGASSIIFSGGWNRTDMSTQTGETYLSGVQSNSSSGVFASSKNYITFEKLNLSRFSNAYQFNDNCTNISVTAKDIINNQSSGITIGATTSTSSTVKNSTFTVTNIQQIGSYGIQEYFACYNNTFNITNLCMNPTYGYFGRSDTQSNITTGTQCRNETINITNLINNGTATSLNVSSGAISLEGITDSQITIGKLSGQKGHFIWISDRAYQSSSNNIIKITNNVYRGTAAPSNYLAFVDTGNNILDLSGQTIDFVTAIKVQNGGQLTVLGGTFSSSGVPIIAYDDARLIAISTSATGITTLAGNNSNGIFYQNYNGSSTDHRIYYGSFFGNIVTDTSIRHTASGISWKMTSVNTADVQYAANSMSPLTLSIAKIAVNSGSLVTASVWVYRTSTSLTTNFVCPAGQLSGVAPSPVSASAAINTWEQLTMTFTPSMAGVVELFVQCYGAAASVYVDDFSVSQA